MAAESAVVPGTVSSFGPELVVWCTVDGRVGVADARCPHQLSHLAEQGRVDGGELVCTAHGWRFTVDGVGSKRNEFGRVDPKADLVVYPTRCVDGVVEADVPR